MHCHICDEPATGQCQTCWKFYCHAHGDVFCESCGPSQASSGSSRGVMMGRISPPDSTDKPLVGLRPGFNQANVLRGVLAIGEVRHTDRTDFSLLSLESYEDGFTVRWRMRGKFPSPQGPLRPRFGGLHPTLLFGSVQDDLGTKYQGGFGGGGGGDNH